MNKYIIDLKQQIEKKCRFCTPSEKERILYETEHFYVMVSLGPIIEGYLLIITKKHIGACLNMPKEYLEEFLDLKKKVKDILIEVYGRCLFYEHGKIGSSLMMTDGHMHCYHAHLHCIPTDINLNDIIEKELHAKSFIDYESCYNEMQKVDKYLYVEDDKIMTYVPDIKIRRQYLRYKLAEALDIIDRWDWVEEQNWDIIEQTIKRLKGYFK